MTGAPVVPDDWEGTPLPTLVERYGDLGVRDLLGRTTGTRLTVREHVELLALGEAIRRHVAHGRQCDVHAALLAGTSWDAVAAALGTGVHAARADYLAWVGGQSWLWDDCMARHERPFGLSPADRATARAFAESP